MILLKDWTDGGNDPLQPSGENLSLVVPSCPWKPAQSPASQSRVCETATGVTPNSRASSSVDAHTASRSTIHRFLAGRWSGRAARFNRKAASSAGDPRFS